MHTAAAAFGLQVDAVAYKREAEGVALTYQQLGEHGGSVAGECDFVWVLQVAMPFEGKEHGAAVVITDNQIEEKLCGSLLDFVGDKERLAERAAKAKLLGHPQASSLVVAEIMRLVENKRNIPIR